MLSWNKISLRNQFLIVFILIQIIISGAIFIYFTYNQKNFFQEQLTTNLYQKSRLMLENEILYTSSEEELNLWVEKMGPEIASRITVVDKEGKVLADSDADPKEMDNHSQRPEFSPVLFEKKGKDTSIRHSNTLNEDMLYLAVPIYQDDKLTGAVRLAAPLAHIHASIRSNVLRFSLFSLAILFLVTAIAWKLSSGISEPLKKLTQTAEQVAQGNLTERFGDYNYENEIGTLGHMFNFMADQLETKLKEIFEEKNRIEAILNSMGDGVIAVDRSKKILVINPTAREMLGFSGEVVHGKALYHLLRNHKIEKLLDQVLSHKQVINEELVLEREEKRILRCEFAPITGGDEESIAGGVMVFTDITELRRLEQIRSEFVANVSHELRTPLTSIMGYVDTLLESKIEDRETLERFLKIIKQEADRQNQLISDLLDLSRLERENQKTHLSPTELLPIINKACSMLKDRAEKKDIVIHKKLDTPPPVMMIPEQIEQVLINLIDNSIKYTPKNGRITVRAYEKDNVDDWVTVEVEDNGIGIPEEDQHRIFERFYRVDKARSRASGGTGIGLSIVKHILQGHGSKIEVESTEDEGSLFRFYLRKAQ